MNAFLRARPCLWQTNIHFAPLRAQLLFLSPRPKRLQARCPGQVHAMQNVPNRHARQRPGQDDAVIEADENKLRRQFWDGTTSGVWIVWLQKSTKRPRPRESKVPMGMRICRASIESCEARMLTATWLLSRVSTVPGQCPVSARYSARSVPGHSARSAIVEEFEDCDEY
jgi:hypothetical protein